MAQNLATVNDMELQNIEVIIPGGRNPLCADDLRRLLDLGRQANDALINYFVDLCMLKPDAFHEMLTTRTSSGTSYWLPCGVQFSLCQTSECKTSDTRHRIIQETLGSYRELVFEGQRCEKFSASTH
jgi:hypothetical protein